MGVHLLCIMARLPRLMRDVSAVVNGSDDDTPRVYVDNLKTRIRAFKADLLHWWADLDGLVQDAMSNEKSEAGRISSEGPNERPEMMGGCLTLHILACRMLCAISMDQSSMMEDEALDYALLLIKTDKEVRPVSCGSHFFLRQKTPMAQAVMATRDIWKRRSAESNLVDKAAFKTWCKAMSRCSGID
jgi:hypothetical protein